MLSQIDVFHDCFDQVDDPRVQGRTVHPLNSILFLVVTATIADADGPEEIRQIDSFFLAQRREGVPGPLADSAKISQNPTSGPTYEPQ